MIHSTDPDNATVPTTARGRSLTALTTLGLGLLAAICTVKLAYEFDMQQIANAQKPFELSSIAFKEERNATNRENFCSYNSSSAACCSESRCQLVVHSSMAMRCCGTDPPQWPLLITGTPRSGTVFVQKAMVEMGFSLNDDWHVPGRDGMVSWIHVFSDTKYFGKGHIHGGRFGTVYHQLRDPLRSLTSIAFTEPMLSPEYMQYLHRHINMTSRAPVEKKRDSVFAALEFYIAWHSFIDSLNVPMFRLEEFNAELVLEIAKNAGFREQSINTTRIENFFDSTKSFKVANQRKHRGTLAWSEICLVDANLTVAFWSLTRKYGYYQNLTNPPCL